MRSRAWSMTCSVWTQTSPSGCHSGSCGQPTSACSSGNSFSTTPRSSASAKPIDGRGANSSFSISPQTRSAGRSSSGIARQNARGLVVEPRARSARRTAPPAARAGCRRRTSPDRRRAGRALSRSPRPSNGSRYSSVSGSQAMALTVKSRRRAASSIDIDGSPDDDEAAVAAAGLRLAARQRDVDVAELVDLEALADGFDAAERLEELRAARPAAMPKTSRSMSFDSRPSSRSRTQPPTISARPPGGADARDRRWLASATAPVSTVQADLRGSHGVATGRPHRLTSRSQKPGASALSSTRPRALRYG